LRGWWGGRRRASSAHTPGYSSPARLSGERSTPTDDVFALGVLLDQLIAGVAGVDEDLRAVAAMAAQEDAAQRYGAVTELIADLDRWQTARTCRLPDRQTGSAGCFCFGGATGC
jgi:hypothetical protein